MRTEHIRKLISEATDKLIADLEAGKSETLAAWLAVMGRLHSYSVRNTILIWMQRPNAYHVAGFSRWRQLGRRVRKGERGIAILAPVVARLAKEDDEEEEEELVAFRPAHVFDVSQTDSIDGRPFAEFARVKGQPGVFLDRLQDFLKARSIALEFAPLSAAIQGMSAGGRIVVKNSLPPAERFAVMVHEAAHELLKHCDQTDTIPKGVREVEAEGVAHFVSHAIGLDTNTACSDYLLLYDGRKNTLLASLERIRSVAIDILEAILNDGEQPGQAAEHQDVQPDASAA